MTPKATEAQIRAKLRELNPTLFGASATPIVAQKVRFILTGVYKGTGETKLKQFTQLSVLSEESKKANPNLRASRYFRITSTDYTKSVTSTEDVINPGRKPWGTNLFENNAPEFFAEISRLLTEKEGDKYKFFEEMPADRDGNPVLKLKNPILAAFIPVQVPGHNIIDPRTNKRMEASTRILGTTGFGPARPVVMREMRLFLFPYQFASLEAIAIAQYQKTIEPMLAEEVVYKMNTAGDIVEEKHTPHTAGETMDPENEEKPATDESGVPLP